MSEEIKEFIVAKVSKRKSSFKKIKHLVKNSFKVSRDEILKVLNFLVCENKIKCIQKKSGKLSYKKYSKTEIILGRVEEILDEIQSFKYPAKAK